MRLLLFAGFILFSTVVLSQEIPPDLLKKMEITGQQRFMDDSMKEYNLSAKKGVITFSYGEKTKFRSLKLERDSLIYLHSDKKIHKIPVSEVSLITVTHRHAGYNALVGGAVGLASGLLAGLLAYPEKNTLTTLVELLLNDENSDGPKLSKKAVPLVLGLTAAGALTGALVVSKNDRTEIYKKSDITVSFLPDITVTGYMHTGYMLTARIRF